VTNRVDVSRSATGGIRRQLSALASPLRAAVCGRVLTGSQRSGEPVREGCGATSRARAETPRASARQIARALRRRLLRGCLHSLRGRARPRAYSCTFTCRSGQHRDIRDAISKFGDTLCRRVAGAGIHYALDRAPATGRWHVHALVLLPPTFDASRLVPWWTRCWPREERPARPAQLVRKLPSKRLRVEIDRVLAHNLGRKRHGETIPLLPALGERTGAFGLLAVPWALVCAAKGISVPNMSDAAAAVPSRAEGSTHPSPTVECRWCSKALLGATRPHAKAHESCRRLASRALCSLEERCGTPTREDAERLERDGIPLREAIRTAAWRRAIAEQMSVPVTRLPETSPTCSCGAPMARRANARSCGRSACRMKALRRRNAPRINGRDLATLLFDCYGPDPFSETIALLVAAKFRFPLARFKELVRVLVKKGVLRVNSEDVYAFSAEPEEQGRARRA
jgi:hypothetical protein